jgi:hypothetical protein
VVSIPACHAGDRGSIPRRGDFFKIFYIQQFQLQNSTIRKLKLLQIISFFQARIAFYGRIFVDI